MCSSFAEVRCERVSARLPPQPDPDLEAQGGGRVHQQTLTRVARMPVQISRGEVAHLAHLARLALPDSDLDQLAGELQVILDAVSQVQRAASADVAPTSHALPLTNVFRPDVVGPSLPQEVFVSQAPSWEDGRFRVPRMLEDEA